MPLPLELPDGTRVTFAFSQTEEMKNPSEVDLRRLRDNLNHCSYISDIVVILYFETYWLTVYIAHPNDEC